MFEHSTSPKTCSECGAHLDSGERCDCTKREEAPAPTETPSKRCCMDKDINLSISDHNSNVNETEVKTNGYDG